MSKANQLLKEVLEQDNLCATLRAKIQVFLDPASNGYRDWKQGDRLVVIDREEQDFLQIGDIVIHDDTDGNSAPWVLTLDGTERYCMSNTELQFMERPE